MKFGVVIFPGSNCDHDMIYVLDKILNKNVVKLWHKDTDLQKCDFIILPGGFSYGDYLRSGAIARFSPIMKGIIDYANNGGHLMGICNGFQILCEAGLLPGALLANQNQKFICKNVYIRSQTTNSVFTSEIETREALKIPIAHGEGRFHIDNDGLSEINANEQVIFRYCDKNAYVNTKANPNGSIDNIAGICNKNRNVFGLMPHPERASDKELSNTDGKQIFDSILKNLG